LLAALVEALLPSLGLPRLAGTGKTKGVVHVHSLIEKYTQETEVLASDEGVTMVEYAIMAAGVAAVLGVAFAAVTGSVSRAFTAVGNAIP
jgi:Flp pilus assembly pilin Flp